jgi:lysine biosynthesis protein LysW
MSGARVSCPACGGPVEFPIASAIVAVCPYCRSVVARGDRRLEDLGKVAALVETDSAFEVGLKGRYQGHPFELTGRSQLGHAAGGTWDEWYAAFADGRWGWLAEAQGRFYLTFEQSPPGELPPFDDLRLGRELHLPDAAHTMTVAEKGQARAVSAEGAIPYRLVPGMTYAYADLSGAHGEFATLDYGSTPPQFYAGREVTLDDLGIPAKARPAAREAREVPGVQLNCPQCGGALELRAPDKSERVVCPNCGALLDVNQGQLRFLKVLEQVPVKPVIPFGSVGLLGGHPFMAIGFLRRSVRVEGVRHSWDEYLLYRAGTGFRWLVCGDGHWSFVEPAPPGSVHGVGRGAEWQGKSFRIFQRARATVDTVLGEFYWKVESGETVLATDFICPPLILSREVAAKEDGGEGEINWSLGTYLPAAEVQKAFGLTSVPSPALSGVAPNQPFPYKRVYLDWALLFAAAVVLLFIVLAINPRRTVFEQTFQVDRTRDPEKPQVEFTEPFDLRARENLLVTVRAEVSNSWVDVEGDLIQEEGDLVQPFSVPVQYYWGTEDGEGWEEGKKEDNVYLSSLPSGNYRMRLEFVTERSPTPVPPVAVRVRLEQGCPHMWTWLLAVLALSVIPALVGVYHFWFERRRWEDSDFSPFHAQAAKEKTHRSK